MATRRKGKIQRQKKLRLLLEANPFQTDEELAFNLGVSIQTVRLDRLELGIPELRERTKQAAAENYGKVKAMSGNELVGELIDIELGKGGISVFKVTDEMVLQKTRICRAHHIFAQANSLAVAIIDAEVVLTGSARVRYERPVYLHEKVVAKGIVRSSQGNKHLVKVVSKVGGEIVFVGNFIVFVKE